MTTQHDDLSGPKSEFLQIRLSEAERELIRAAAAADHLSPSTWARRLLLKEAERVATATPAGEGS